MWAILDALAAKVPKANDIAAQLSKLAPIVVHAPTWPGPRIAPALLSRVGLTL